VKEIDEQIHIWIEISSKKPRKRGVVALLSLNTKGKGSGRTSPGDSRVKCITTTSEWDIFLLDWKIVLAWVFFEEFWWWKQFHQCW
jgi:hypothetical protein